MITRVEVSSQYVTSPIPLGSGQADDPLQIHEITGLEPVKAEITKTPYATKRGVYKQGSNTQDRNPVLTIGFAPNWAGGQTIASLRKLVYGYFMPEQWVNLRFFSDDYGIVDIQGYVESCEPNIFSEEPEMQVSVICPDPDFIDPDPVLLTGVVPNSLTDGEPYEYEFDYDGSVSTGFVIRVKHSDTKPSYTGPISIVNESLFGQDVFQIETASVDATKFVQVSTNPIQRRIKSVPYEITDENPVKSLLQQKIVGSTWPMLRPGKNVLSIGAAESGLKWDLVYYNRYGGL